MKNRAPRSALPALLGPADPRRDRLGIATIVAAILLFVAIASLVLARVMAGTMAGDRVMLVALLLNVALLLFSWRRHSAMRAALADEASAARAGLLGTTDALTGLGNRRALAEEGAALLAQAQRRGKVVALMLLDIDGLKQVNERHGAGFGDQTLAEIGRAVTEVLPLGCVVARMNSDSFAAALLFDAAYPETVDRLAERMLARFGRGFQVAGVQVPLGVSIGLARSDIESSGIEGLLRVAGLALSAAKETGSNRCAWFDEGMARALAVRTKFEAALRDAVAKGAILPCFAPRVDLATGRLAGFEVVPRWEGAQGAVEADGFMPLAEEVGLIDPLFEAVVRHALAQARDWDPSLRLAISLAPAQLRDPWAAQKLLKLLSESGFAPQRIDIQLTEAGLMHNLTLAQSLATSLKAQGARLVLDRFGTGYAAIGHLRALAFDGLKLDRGFAVDLVAGGESLAVTTAIARLAESLNLPASADGVADAATAERLQTLGYASAQGAHFGGLLSAAGARRMLAEQRLIVAAA